MNPLIKNVTVDIKGKGTYIAKLIEVDPGKLIWFVFLPSSTSGPFDIEGFNEEGDLIASKTITDPRDSGTIDFRMDANGDPTSKIVNNQDLLALLNISLPKYWNMDKSDKVDK